MKAHQINKRLEFSNEVFFRSLSNGMEFIEIDTIHATAMISVQGAQVLSWRPKSQDEPVLWVSSQAHYTPGKAIRGGAPICWPWFGPHPSDSKIQGHGYARLSQWKNILIEKLETGEIRLCFSLIENKSNLALFPHKLDLGIEIIVGNTLNLTLTTFNEGHKAVNFTEGLHTYFKVGDISQVSVTGLDGVEYVDLVRNNSRSLQKGDLCFDNEFGRIYLNTSSECVIQDPILMRKIKIIKKGSLSTAVWNPWAVLASKMVDLEDNEWTEMLCVESANALDNSITLLSGESHTHFACYSVEGINV